MAFTVETMTGGNADMAITIESSDKDPELNITGGASSILYLVEVDCTKNPGQDVYVRFFDNADPPVVGTTSAEVLVWGKAGEKVGYAFRRGIPFAVAMAVATVTDPGGTSGATNPTGTVKLRILVDSTPPA